jgi:hypothetical protein
MKRLLTLALLACMGAHAQTASQLVRDDLETYLDGGSSALGWQQLVTTARELQAAYAGNEVAAGIKYGTGADIVVSGTVQRVAMGYVALSAGERPWLRVLAYDLPEQWVAGLTPGQRVRIACRTVRKTIVDPALRQCEPLAAYVERMVAQYVRELPRLAAAGNEGARLVQQRAQRR